MAAKSAKNKKLYHEPWVQRKVMAGLIAGRGGGGRRGRVLGWLGVAAGTLVVLCGLAVLHAAGGGRRGALLERPAAAGAAAGAAGDLEDPFYERNAQLDARQREIDEARAQILAAVLAQDARTAKGAMQSLYMESDAAPSGAMLQEYWKDFTALPPSHRPGLGSAASPADLDARIRRLRTRSARLGAVARTAETAEQRAAEEEAGEEDDMAVGARSTQLDELSGTMAGGDGTMAGDGLMAAGGSAAGSASMAGGGSMASSITPCVLDDYEGGWDPCGGNMATGGLQADGGHLFNRGRMAARGGGTMAAGAGLMAGDGLLSDPSSTLADDNILANENLLSSHPNLLSSYGSYKVPARVSLLAQQPRDAPAPATADEATSADSKGDAQARGRGAIFVDRFVPAWRPWRECGSATGPETQAVCRAMKEMGERGEDGMGGAALYAFRAVPAQSLREVQSAMGRQQRLASKELSSALEPLNVMQAELNLERLRLVRALLLPELRVEGEVGDEGQEAAEQPVLMVEEDGRLVRAVLYTSISNGSDGGFNAPYDLNGDGQYVDNWAKVSTDWSYTQPRGGYLSPMPGSNPGPDSMGGRPPVMWKNRGSPRMTALTGSVPAWTQSPWLSIFSDASARKVRGAAVSKALGLDLTDTVAPAQADTPTADLIPDYQRVAAKNSPEHTRFEYAPPRDSGVDCHTLSGDGCKEGARQGASVTGTPLTIEYHPLRLVPESKFVKGKNVEEVAAEAEAERAREAREEDANYLNDADFPKDLDEFEARRAGKMYIHTYMHTYMHTYIHTCIHTYMHTYIHT